MSKNKGSSDRSKPPPAPQPENEFYYVDGNLESSRTKGTTPDGQSGWMTNVYRTPQEKSIESQSLQFISDLVPQAAEAFNMSPEGIQQYKDAYTQPQVRALNEGYNQALGAATNAASSSGTRNSVGFEKYRANEIERNRAQGLADIEANAKMMEYQLPAMRLAPFVDAFNLYNAALSGEQANQMSTAGVAQQGSQMANNFALQNYGNQLSAWNARQNQPKSSGGFFSQLLGLR